MRKVLIAIAVIVVVVIAGAAIFVATFDVNKYRGTIQAQLQQHLGRPVQLGDMHLKLFPPSITVQNLAIAEDPRFNSDAPFVKARELDVSVKLFPLLHKDVEIQSLDLEQPTVNLIKNKAGQWNFASIGSGNTSSASQSSQQQFSLGDLVIKDGEISLLDQTQSSTPLSTTTSTSSSQTSRRILPSMLTPPFTWLGQGSRRLPYRAKVVRSTRRMRPSLPSTGRSS